jgi:enoyl-CoA hydratase/3-hydroxyacyl-CoA dehydrogenase
LSINKVAVIGAGDMGHGIAELFAVNGYEVTLMDKFPEAIEKARARVGASLEKLVERGKLSKEQAAETLSRLTFSGEIPQAVRDADLVVEAVPESAELKRSVIREASEHAPQGALIASNTSNIRISDLAKAASRPDMMVGMHFFNPPMLMKLVEIIPGERTDPSVVTDLVEVSTKLGRTPITVQKDSPGFIVNRINAADTLFFCLILDKGLAGPPEVDNYARGQGLPMGPYELLDFVGVDIGADSLAYFAQALSPEYGKGKTFARMVNEGLLGKKTGKGFYDWSSGRADIPKVPATDKVTIMDIFAIEINEAVKLIEEGVATPDDIEKGVTLGMNRPFGPISVAKDLSNAEVKAKLEELASKFDCGVFAPAASIASGRLRDAIEGRLGKSDESNKDEGNKAGSARPSAGGGQAGAVRVEKLPGGVARVVLNRPRFNTINAEIIDGLKSAVADLSNDTEVRAVVFTGEGDVFSAGADLSQFFSNSLSFTEYARKGARVMRSISEMPKLTIAVLKGYALGGGLELAISCDLRVATEQVEIGFPEVSRGLVPAWSGSQRLPKLIGVSHASSLILAGERITGKRAVEIGLVHRLVRAEDPDRDALELAKSLAASQAPVALNLAKKLINKGAEVSIDDGLEMEAMAAGLIFGTEDLREGLSAFKGRRKAEFKGR